MAAWNDFLSNDQNKCELTNLLIDCILDGKYCFNRPIYVAKEERCLIKYPNSEVVEVGALRSNLKEADPRLALHAVYASKMLLDEPISLVSDDTDVFVILLSVTKEMKGALYFRQGVSSNLEFHNVTSLASYLGERCCDNLPSFHALTGCDFTYPFFRRTKTTAFTMMMNLKNAKKCSATVNQLDSLGTRNPDFEVIIDFILHTIYN